MKNKFKKSKKYRLTSVSGHGSAWQLGPVAVGPAFLSSSFHECQLEAG